MLVELQQNLQKCCNFFL